jgi:hypothetical protein
MPPPEVERVLHRSPPLLAVWSEEFKERNEQQRFEEENLFGGRQGKERCYVRHLASITVLRDRIQSL